jgi:hypothetical protein
VQPLNADRPPLASWTSRSPSFAKLTLMSKMAMKVWRWLRDAGGADRPPRHHLSPGTRVFFILCELGRG